MAHPPVRDAATALSTALADRYRVERELGAGGMATVYLAEDLKHRRRVAIKVLRPELAAVIGADRFLREIETIAGLQHPHILGLIDSGEVNGTAYYVMPFVEGESLRDRLARERQLPVGDAIRIATEVAGALDYAHRHGVIHRDIKPENILLHDGQALVADFGIALAASKVGGDRMTETGMSLGTPQYMSPEQAMGEREITSRSDIYALGATAYEMLAGEPPFTGPTAQAIVAKIVATEPERLSALRKTVPPHVEDAVLTALEKIPADRFASASAFAAALAGTSAVPAGRTGRTRVAAAASRRRRLLWPAVAAVLAVVALAGWLHPWSAPATSADLPPTQLALLLPDLGGAGTGLQHQIEITPDGASLLYVALVDGNTRTKRIGLDGSEGRVLEGVPPNLADYSVSLDGSSFTAASAQTGAIFRYPIAGMGGKPFPRGVPWGLRGAWASDGAYWMNDNSSSDQGVTRVSTSDSVTRPFGKRNADHVINQILPGDRTALAIKQPVGNASGPVMLLDLGTGESRVLVDDAVVEARYAAGHLVYVLADGSLQAAPFDLGASRLLAPAVMLASGVTLTGGGVAQFAVAPNGTVAYVVEAGRTLVVSDRAGAGRTVMDVIRNYHHPRFSPDGRRIAVDFNGPEGRDVWILSLSDGALTRATFDRDGHDATWSRDGRMLAYTSFRNRIFGVHRVVPGSTDSADSLLSSTSLGYTGIWLRDGSALVTVGQSLRPESNLDIGILRNGGRGPLEPLVATRFVEQYPAVSGDDQWLAFSSNQSGREEVYVRRLEGGGEQIQVSVGGGTEPVWSPDGQVLYYRGATNAESRADPMIMAAAIARQPALAVVSRTALFSASGIVTANPHGNFDVSPDGKSFVFVRANPSSRVMIIQNLAGMVTKKRAGGRGTP
ncbi:MAG TPA: protein kinase [Gemmatimonadaceae bacterium]|nr:protein kinase [Gemmatimonadaceae bacterium]